jgi:hypothetical protein
MKTLHSLTLTLLCLLLGYVTPAQDFRYTAPVDPVAESGFHKILLSPAITGAVQADFADLRLQDAQGREVPYLLTREQPLQRTTRFREYELVSQRMQEKKGTSLILRNPQRSRINNISLQIKNASVRKQAQLSGSNDARTWYVINERYELQPIANTAETSEVKLLDFPLSDYEYYKLDINDSLSPPLNILKAGYYDTYTEDGKYTRIPGLSVQVADSAARKQTYVRLTLDQPALVDKLTFRVVSPAYYRRTARLGEMQVITGKRKKDTRTAFVSLADFELKSGEETSVLLPGARLEDFYFIIDNADNPPLQLSEIQAYQLNTYVTAQLEGGQAYRMQFGNERLRAPAYDLAYFGGKIPAEVPVLNTGEMTALSAADSPESTAFFTSNFFIWIALGITILGLGYMSFRLMTEAGKQ